MYVYEDVTCAMFLTACVVSCLCVLLVRAVPHPCLALPQFNIPALGFGIHTHALHTHALHIHALDIHAICSNSCFCKRPKIQHIHMIRWLSKRGASAAAPYRCTRYASAPTIFSNHIFAKRYVLWYYCLCACEKQQMHVYTTCFCIHKHRSASVLALFHACMTMICLCIMGSSSKNLKLSPKQQHSWLGDCFTLMLTYIAQISCSSSTFSLLLPACAQCYQMQLCTLKYSAYVTFCMDKSCEIRRMYAVTLRLICETWNNSPLHVLKTRVLS